LFACLAGVESYIGRLQDGVVMLVAEDRVPILTPIAVLYGSYLAGIIVFWFRPFYSNAGTPGLQRIRFWLALIPSAALNLIMVYLVWHNHFDSSTTIQEEVSNGVKICRLLSFLAGPAMLYYFGFRIRVSGE
jgi:hypothetical protein